MRALVATLAVTCVVVLAIVVGFTSYTDPVRVCSIEQASSPGTSFNVVTTEGTYHISREAIKFRDEIQEGGTYKLTRQGDLPLISSNTITAIEPINSSLVSATCP